MSDVPDRSSWTFVGESPTTRFYQLESHILIGDAIPGARDTVATANQSIDIYLDYFRRTGTGILVYRIGRAASQDGAARRLYRERADDPTLLHGVVLVAESMLARAIGSFFLGLAKPRNIPLVMRRSLPEALVWARSRLAECSERDRI